MTKPARMMTITFALVAVCGAPLALGQDAGERYAKLLADADSIERHNAHMERTIELQKKRLENVQAEIAGLDETGTETPLLIQRMYQELESFIATDLPFIDPSLASPDHRADRMERLREIMEDETVNQGEKFRRIMETCQIEIEYGRTLASYKSTLPDGREADFVRVGRVSLLYRTIGEEPETGYWDAQKKSWVAENEFSDAVKLALQIATKVKAPDVIAVPVPVASEVRS